MSQPSYTEFSYTEEAIVRPKSKHRIQLLFHTYQLCQRYFSESGYRCWVYNLQL